jgi:hypothetical protein
VYSTRTLFVLLTTLVLTASVRAQSPPAACSTPEYHQFDFWVGDWEVLGGGKPVAHVVVDKILNGCVIRERYSEPQGYEGQSFNIYDAGRHYWRQTWMTNRGKFLAIRGNLQGGSMVLFGTDYDSTPPRLVRGAWKPVKGGVEEIAITSTDDGKTWTTWFDLFFRPFHKSP